MTTMALSRSLLFSPAQGTYPSAIEATRLPKKFDSPQTFLVGRIGPGWQVIQPLAINLEYDEDGAIIASDDLFYVYGCGETRRAAIQDYAISLIEYYEILSSYSDSASRSLFDVLKQYLSYQ